MLSTFVVEGFDGFVVGERSDRREDPLIALNGMLRTASNPMSKLVSHPDNVSLFDRQTDKLGLAVIVCVHGEIG